MPNAQKPIICPKCEFSFSPPQSPEIVCPNCQARMTRKSRSAASNSSATMPSAPAVGAVAPAAASAAAAVAPTTAAAAPPSATPPDLDSEKKNEASPEWADAEGADLWWLWLAAAFVVGSMGALILSLLKPNLAMTGLIFSGVGFAAIALAAVAFAHTRAQTWLRRSGPESAAHLNAKTRARNLTMASFVAVVLIGCGIILETKAPPEGVVRSWTKEEEPPPPPPKPTLPDFLASAVSAEMVLINPTHYAVALDYDRAARTFRVVSKFETDEPTADGGIPWGQITMNGQRVVSENIELTQAVYKNFQVGDLVQGPLYGRLATLYREYRFLPAGAQLVSFHDIKTQRQRVGYMLSGDFRDPSTRDFVFCNLSPRATQSRLQLLRGSRGESLTSNDLDRLAQAPGLEDLEIERIPRSQIRPSSWQARLNDEALKANADFLDYAIYHIVKQLETAAGEPGYVRVVVAAGELDTSHLVQMVKDAELLNERERNKSQAIGNTNAFQLEKEERDANLAREMALLRERGRIQSPATSETIYGEGPLGVMAAMALSMFSQLTPKPPSLEQTHFTQVTQELQQLRNSQARPRERVQYDSMLSNLLGEMRRLDGLARNSSRISSDVEARLSACGIPLVTRTPGALALIQAEAARGAMIQGQPPHLMGATHVVIPVVREAEDTSNASSLELKLVDMTGTILWTGIGDRAPKPMPPGGGSLALDPASLPFMLHSGQLMVVDFQDDVVLGSAPAQAEDVAGGFPIRLDEKMQALRSGAAAERAKVLAMTSDKRRKIGNTYWYGKPKVPADYYRRIAYEESGLFGDKTGFPMRDPFELTARTVPSQHVLTNRRPVTTLNDVPESHRMRYLVWEIARCVLPPAGRVLSVNDNEATVDIGTRDLATTLPENQVFQVLRLDPNDAAKRSFLGNTIQVTDSKVHPIKGFIGQAEGEAVKPGDIAVAVPRDMPLLAIQAFYVAPTSPGLQPSRNAQTRKPDADDARRRLDTALKMCERLVSQLRNGLNQANVPVTAADSGQSTYRLRGKLTRYDDTKSASFDIEVLDRAGNVIQRLPFTYLWNVCEYWTP